MQIAQEYSEIAAENNIDAKEVNKAISRAESRGVERILKSNETLKRRKALAEHTADLIVSLVKHGGARVANKGRLVYDLQKAMRNQAELELIFRGLGGVIVDALDEKLWIGKFQRIAMKHQSVWATLDKHGISILDLNSAISEPVAV